MQIFLRAVDETVPESPIEVVTAWHDSHWGTRLLEVRDPDGRSVMVQAFPKRP